MDQIKIGFSKLLEDVSGTREVEKLNEQLALAGKQKEASKKVVRWPDKRLKTVCPTTFYEYVHSAVGSSLDIQIAEMKEVLRLLNGVGIAANQLGYNNRVCICWFGAREEKDMVVMINPVINQASGDWIEMKEACLSADQCVGTIKRRELVTVSYFDKEGFMHVGTYSGWDARIVQHELDHLNGIVIVDKFTPADKMFNRPEIERLQLEAGIVPKRLANKGLTLKHTENGKHKYVFTR